MVALSRAGRPPARLTAPLLSSLSLGGTLLVAAACATSGTSSVASAPSPGVAPFGDVFANVTATAPNPDPRVGLHAGLWDAGQAFWNMRLLSTTKPSEKFAGITNSDLAFIGPYVIQGSYNGFQVWDISNPSKPTLKEGYLCPASQSDVSVYKNLLFVSGEGLTGRVDCGTQGVQDTVSSARLRGLRIFDISDLNNPRNVGNVQTCRGSHTHTLLVDPKDPNNVYIYISGSYIVRSASELAGCSNANPDQDPNSAKFRLEVIKVPLAHPDQAAIVSSPRIFNDLAAPPEHGMTAQERADLAAAKAKGAYTVTIYGEDRILPNNAVNHMLDSLVKVRGGTGAPTAADSAKLRSDLQPMIDARMKAMGFGGPRTGPTQCHDITVYPQIGLAGGACEGYGFLLDIHDPAHPVRIDQVSDSNFSYWHSATFNNDGTKILFTDEWGGGGAPKCRASDPKEWGADAIFTIVNNKLVFQSYYKLPAPQTPQENCVAHNGSLIPIPGRDVMVQSWYQGGVSVFDWTNPKRPREIAFFDRGPVDSTRMASGGTWSAYWYNGVIVSSEIARGLDILELTPGPFISQNEIDAAKSVHFDEFNTQGQPRLVWPPSFALAGAYLDQLARSNGLAADKVSSARQALASAQGASGAQRRDALNKLSSELDGDANGAGDPAKVRTLASAVKDLASATS